MPEKNEKNLSSLISALRSVQQQDISCDECFEHVDEYVDMLQSGQDAAEVLPHVKQHLEQCRCCHSEFNALIRILEQASLEP
jgi:deoxycytidylate deaminase